MDGIWIEMAQIGAGLFVCIFGYACMMAIGEGDDDDTTGRDQEKYPDGSKCRCHCCGVGRGE